MMNLEKMLEDIGKVSEKAQQSMGSLSLIKEKNGDCCAINKQFVKAVVPSSNGEGYCNILIGEDKILVNLTVEEVLEQLKKATV